LQAVPSVLQAVQSTSSESRKLVGQASSSYVVSQISDPAQTLLDLQLPQHLLDLLGPPIDAWGLTLTPAQASDEYGQQRKYTLVKENAIKRVLLYIPGWILDEASPANISAMESVVYAFEKDSVLIIFSDRKIDSPARAFRKIVERLWRDKQDVKGHFVPWRDIEELKLLKLEAQKLWVRDTLQLSHAHQSGQAVPPMDQIQPHEIDKLVQIISTLPQVIDEPARTWRGLFRSPGLNKIIGHFILNGDPRTVARTVVEQLILYRPMPEKPDHEVLGLLLSRIVGLPDLPQPDSAFINDIMRKYRLVPLS
jgi:hypothetical protein